MLNGRLLSTKEIVLKTLRDNGYQVQDFTFSDMVEWIGECMDLIGCAYSLRQTMAFITIENHRGILPCDFHTPIQASAFDCCSGVQIPMRTANNTFHPLFFQNPNSTGIVDPNTPLRYDANGNPIFDFLNYDEAISRQLVTNLGTSIRDVTYHLNDNYIFTSFKDGAKVLFSYYAYPLDKEGFPMIPDNIKFREATAAFLRYKIDYKQWRRGKLSSEVFNHSERERDWYIGAATTAGNAPDIDTLESWKNQLGRLIPRFNEHASMFIDLGNQESLTFSSTFFRH